MQERCRHEVSGLLGALLRTAIISFSPCHSSFSRFHHAQSSRRAIKSADPCQDRWKQQTHIRVDCMERNDHQGLSAQAAMPRKRRAESGPDYGLDVHRMFTCTARCISRALIAIYQTLPVVAARLFLSLSLLSLILQYSTTSTQQSQLPSTMTFNAHCPLRESTIIPSPERHSQNPPSPSHRVRGRDSRLSYFFRTIGLSGSKRTSHDFTSRVLFAPSSLPFGQREKRNPETNPIKPWGRTAERNDHTLASGSDQLVSPGCKVTCDRSGLRGGDLLLLGS
ncbi:hypothetical protein BDZ85DRAFT_265856 [Elsinoe ampelina]|uniref:Uncharacterized protein n=1 Tax=Elsinoe ampelina TaxID=302913 RepID=A0A6A6G600_9PEZI|nr:hypothetical protein BDZ85DRAFT_265856 [Elsinoe ampelina]